ncbi:MAG: hypothetical protein U5K43_12540 [Halofilum sp. (in: g-proteobacteria)]|nr:hypothetical protein [Halofilum sp. (in: g-proteobacteria)]
MGSSTGSRTDDPLSLLLALNGEILARARAGSSLDADIEHDALVRRVTGTERQLPGSTLGHGKVYIDLVRSGRNAIGRYV